MSIYGTHRLKTLIIFFRESEHNLASMMGDSSENA